MYHKNGNTLKCHYCGFIAFPSDICPKCNTQSIVEYGFVTERIVHELQNLYPNAKILRLDRDTVSHSAQIDTILQNFKQHKADILVGTQMVTKGHDFHQVTCVGVLMADTALMFPDFRAGEYAFSQLTQIIGRSGRGQKPGSVIVQTYTPEHYVIQMAANHDREGFFSKELKERKIAG